MTDYDFEHVAFWDEFETVRYEEKYVPPRDCETIDIEFRKEDNRKVDNRKVDNESDDEEDEVDEEDDEADRSNKWTDCVLHMFCIFPQWEE